MILAESQLLRAVKAQIDDTLGVTVNTDAVAKSTLVRVDRDDKAPCDASIVFIAVCPGATRPGPRHNTAGGVYDFIYSVEVTIFRRITDVPRDREADPYLYLADSLNALAEDVIGAIDWQDDLLDRVNELLEDEAAGEAGFIQHLKLQSFDPKPVPVTSSDYGGDEREPRAGIKRKFIFGDARRIHTRT
jgi:hypothetical protein